MNSEFISSGNGDFRFIYQDKRLRFSLNTGWISLFTEKKNSCSTILWWFLYLSPVWFPLVDLSCRFSYFLPFFYFNCHDKRFRFSFNADWISSFNEKKNCSVHLLKISLMVSFIYNHFSVLNIMFVGSNSFPFPSWAYLGTDFTNQDRGTWLGSFFIKCSTRE